MQKKEFFTVLRLHRNDLVQAGYKDAIQATDQEMQSIADDLGDSLTGDQWTDSIEAIMEAREYAYSQHDNK